MKHFCLLILALLTSLSSATDVQVGFTVEVTCATGCQFNNAGLINLEKALTDAIADGGDVEVYEVNSLRRSLEEVGADEFVKFSVEAELGHSRRVQACVGFSVCFDLTGVCSKFGACPEDDSDARNLRGLNNGDSHEAILSDAIDLAFADNLEFEIKMHGTHCNGGQAAVCSATVINIVFS
jgi:hypothetical protein